MRKVKLSAVLMCSVIGMLVALPTSSSGADVQTGIKPGVPETSSIGTIKPMFTLEEQVPGLPNYQGATWRHPLLWHSPGGILGSVYFPEAKPVPLIAVSTPIQGAPITVTPEVKPQPVETLVRKDIIVIDGHKYIETGWRSARASTYDSGSATAWCEGRRSAGYWDPINNKWVQSNRKLYFPNFMGKHDWHDFQSYRKRIPTVAHKRHEFGTLVRFRYDGQVQTAMVTDRGPYISGREWDLNTACAEMLGFEGVHTLEYTILKRVE